MEEVLLLGGIFLKGAYHCLNEPGEWYDEQPTLHRAIAGNTTPSRKEGDGK